MLSSEIWGERESFPTTVNNWDVDGKVSCFLRVSKEENIGTREEQALAQDKEEFPMTRNAQRWVYFGGGVGERNSSLFSERTQREPWQMAQRMGQREEGLGQGRCG